MNKITSLIALSDIHHWSFSTPALRLYMYAHVFHILSDRWYRHFDKWHTVYNVLFKLGYLASCVMFKQSVSCQSSKYYITINQWKVYIKIRVSPLLTVRPWAECGSCFTRGFFFSTCVRATQASTRPNFESRNLWCLLANSCLNINKSHLSREKIKNPALVKNYIFSPEI